MTDQPKTMRTELVLASSVQLYGNRAERVFTAVLTRRSTPVRLLICGPVEVLGFSCEGELGIVESNQRPGATEYIVLGRNGRMIEPPLPAGSVLALHVRDASTPSDRGWVLTWRWPFLVRTRCSVSVSCSVVYDSSTPPRVHSNRPLDA